MNDQTDRLAALTARVDQLEAAMRAACDALAAATRHLERLDRERPTLPAVAARVSGLR